MGVTGLWRLIESTGKPVPVETLENKVLAVDISIWLHQMVKGYQDSKGAPVPNAHLIGLFQRLCKLLYFRIKPVFVFDGAFPELKKETIAKRQDNKSRYQSESERLKRELALVLSKKTAISNLLGKQISPKKVGGIDSARAPDNDDIFKLPALPEKLEESESESEDETSSSSIDLHSIDLESESFKNMPVNEKYDVLLELKETRKQNSWGRLHELPKKSDNFSNFQLDRLLKRRKVQECLEDTEKEMGKKGMSLLELENLLNEEGISTNVESIATNRIASNNTTRYLLISDMQKARAETETQKSVVSSKNKPENNSTKEEVKPSFPSSSSGSENSIKKDELDEDLEKAIKMSLGIEEDTPNVSSSNKTDDSWTSCLTDSDNSNDGTDSEEGDGFEVPSMANAKAYIMQYTDFSNHFINKITKTHTKNKTVKPSIPKVDEILQELEQEKSIIVDQIEVNSDKETDTVKEIIQNTIKIESSDSEDESDSNIDYLNRSGTSESRLDGFQEDIISLNTNDDTLDKEKVKGNSFIDEISKDVPEISNQEKADSSDSSDDDFEEVVDDRKFIKSVVQLTLNVGQPPDEDDIFADVFTHVPTHNKVDEIIDCVANVKQEMLTVVKDSTKLSIAEHAKEETVISSEFISTIKDDRTPSLTTKISEQKSKNYDDRILERSTDISERVCDIEAKVNLKESKIDKNKQNPDLNTSCAYEESNKIPGVIPQPMIAATSEKLNAMVENMHEEEQHLLQEKGRLDRIGRNITEQMTKEAQELLQIFGIPYIVAPMEAEAQCAFLESIKLTDGTITDDSDIWLFGGKTVYKNFFNHQKHVLQFRSEAIEQSFNLSREKLILLAILVGSDYTTGITGVGPVTALEILASFPYNRKVVNESDDKAKSTKLVDGLQEFKRWLKSGRKTDNTSLKRKLKNVQVTDDFPSVRVVQAYLDPNIEKSKDKFTWGELDITVLRDYTRAKFGWSQNKLDEIIKPVLKRLQDRNSQKSIQDYFQRKVVYQASDDQMSKRVKAAVQKMAPGGSTLPDPLLNEEPKKKLTKRRKVTKKTETSIKEISEEVTSNISAPTKAKRQKTTEELPTAVIKVKTLETEESKDPVDIKITKTDRFQEVIPQRENVKQNLLENKLKAIELFRKTKLDRKTQPRKRRVILPKEKAELSESDSD